MTVPNLDYEDTITEAWCDAVTDQLNGLPPFVEAAAPTVTANASGKATITFATPFASSPVVVAQLNVVSTADRSLYISARSATSFEVCISNAGAVVSGGSYGVNYIAIGTPA